MPFSFDETREQLTLATFKVPEDDEEIQETSAAREISVDVLAITNGYKAAICNLNKCLCLVTAFQFRYTHQLQLLLCVPKCTQHVYMWHADSDGSMMSLSTLNWCQKTSATSAHGDDLDSGMATNPNLLSSGHFDMW